MTETKLVKIGEGKYISEKIAKKLGYLKEGYYEAGKEVPVSSGVAEKLGLITKEEAEKNKEAIFIVRKESKNIQENNQSKKIDLSSLNKETYAKTQTMQEIKKDDKFKGISDETSIDFAKGFGLGVISRIIPPIGIYLVGKSAHDVGKLIGTSAGESIREKDITPLKQSGKSIIKSLIEPENIGFVAGYSIFRPKINMKSSIETFQPQQKKQFKIEIPKFEKTIIESSKYSGELRLVKEKTYKLETPGGKKTIDFSDTTKDNLYKVDKVLDDVLKEKHSKKVEISLPETKWVSEVKGYKIDPIIETRSTFFGLKKTKRYLIPEKRYLLIKELEFQKIGEKSAVITKSKRLNELTKTEKGIGYREIVDIDAKRFNDLITIDTREKPKKGYLGDFYDNKIINMGRVFQEREAKLDKMKFIGSNKNKLLLKQKLRQQQLLKQELKQEQGFQKLRQQQLLKQELKQEQGLKFLFRIGTIRQKMKLKQGFQKLKVEIGKQNLKLSSILKPKNLQINKIMGKIENKPDVKTIKTQKLIKSIKLNVKSSFLKKGEIPLKINQKPKFNKPRQKNQIKDVIPLADPFEFSKKLKNPIYKNPTSREKGLYLYKTLTTGRFPYQKR